MDIAVPKTNYTVRTAAYEGPFELLIDLIEKRKLLVSDIALAAVTDEFIQHVKSQADFPMEDATNFIAVAATLLLIKSKSLIPELELSEEEEGSIDDLQRRLALYEKTREAARELGRIFGRSVMLPAGEKAPEIVFAPSSDMSTESLAKALAAALAALEKVEELPEARVKPTVTIEEMMDSLLNRVQRALTLSFKEFSGEAKERVEVIVSFLALLELVKMGHVDADQGANFADIKITNTTSSVPRY
ncbi:MAG TPA: ScpA family protein [Candidatus Paceibacterota bacterium]|nr:ScpA family protein [Candidatus Paceibacterota bacterium]